MLVGLLSDILKDVAGNESLRYALIITSSSTLISIVILLRLKSFQAKQGLLNQDPINS